MKPPQQIIASWFLTIFLLVTAFVGSVDGQTLKRVEESDFGKTR